MALTQWKPVSWNPNEDVTDEKLNAMVSNMDYLRDNMVHARYGAFDVTTDVNVKLIGGIVYLPTWVGPVTSTRINFSGFFSSGCKPIITANAIVSNYWNIVTTTMDLTAKAPPDSNGFILTASYVDRPKGVLQFPACHVAWMAMGY